MFARKKPSSQSPTLFQSNQFGKSQSRSRCIWLLLLLTPICFASWNPLKAQDQPSQQNTEVDSSTIELPEITEERSPTEVANQSSDPNTLPSVPAAAIATPAANYDWLVLLPAGIAILLAIAARQVVLALLFGVMIGAYMYVPYLPADHSLASPDNWFDQGVAGLRLTFEHYILGVLTSKDMSGIDHMKIIIFTLTIGFMVGVLGANGGTAGLVSMVVGKSKSVARATLSTYFAGLVVFFDDYANCMIVGPTMRPVFDRLRISRAKLAYIVDSTAAPVASLALIGTWIGAEIAFLQSGLDLIPADSFPTYLKSSDGSPITAMDSFIQSIPFRYYPILALIFVFFTCLLGRDFGPMKRAQRRALSEGLVESPQSSDNNATVAPKPRGWLGFWPIFILVVATLVVLAGTSLRNPATQPYAKLLNIPLIDAENGELNQEAKLLSDEEGATWLAQPWWRKGSDLLSGADPYLAILYGAVLAALASIVLSAFAKGVSVAQAADAGLESMGRMFPAIVVLVLAWSISAVSANLQVGDVVSEKLRAGGFSIQWLPLAVFLAASLISFSTGTSWTTMSILCPVTVQVFIRLAGDDSGIDPNFARMIYFESIGAVLAGAIFGDHCSPISDTTVLSSIASGCKLEEHVWTQLPYALFCAFLAIAVREIGIVYFNLPWLWAMGAGVAMIVFVLFVVGRKPKPFPAVIKQA